MKYIKEILLAFIVILMFFTLKTYQQNLKFKRFRIVNNPNGFDSLFDSKTNRMYLQLPNKNNELFFYEQSDFIKNSFNAKGYLPEDLFNN